MRGERRDIEFAQRNAPVATRDFSREIEVGQQRHIMTPKALMVGVLVVVAVNLLAPFSD